MGIHGLIGYRIGDTTVAQYQGYDSYPHGVGDDFLRDVRELVQDRGRVLELIHDIHVVRDAQEKPPRDVLLTLQAAGTMGNPNQYALDDITWYWALRNNQGEFKKTLESGYIINSTDFADDDLFCEWAYIWDLIRMEVHVYTNRSGLKVVDNPIPFGKLYHVGRFAENDLPVCFDENHFNSSEED